MDISDPTLAELVDEYARAYFADHASVFEALPGEFPREALVDLSPMGRTLVEMVLTDWFERIEKLVAPIRLIARRLQEGPLPSVELIQAVEELRQLSPGELRDRVDWLIGHAGDPQFEATVSLFWVALQEEDRRAAEAHLTALGGTRLAHQLAKRTGAPQGEAAVAVMQAAYEIVEKAVDRRDRWTRSQRGVFRKALARAAAMGLDDAHPHKAKPERVSREAASRGDIFEPTRPEPSDTRHASQAPVEPDQLGASTLSPDAQLRAADDAEDLIRELDRAGLSARERELALVLALGGAPTLAEAALDLGIAGSTARVLAHRMRRKLGGARSA
jgi:DNA-binding CsgD family transcriptional regulator